MRKNSGSSSVFSSRSHLSSTRRTSSAASSAILNCRRRCCPRQSSRLLSCLWAFWGRLRRVLQRVVAHNYFKRAIFMAILLNTFSMGIEYHNQPPSLSHAVEISNVIFTGELLFQKRAYFNC